MADFISAMRYAICCVCGLAIAENLLAVVVFAATAKLRTKHNSLVVNLTLADLMYAVFTIPSVWRYDVSVLGGVASAAVTVSLLTVLAVAVNRYLSLAVQPPGRYDALVTGGRLVGACVAFWCVGLAYGLAIYVSDSTFHVVDSVVYPLTVGIMWAANAFIYWRAFREIRRYSPLASEAGAGETGGPDRARVRQTRRVLVAFAVIMSVMFVTWVPALVLRLMSFFDPTLWASELYLGGTYAAYFLYTVSTVVNPLIYMSRFDGFKEGFYAVFCRCCAKKTFSEIQADNSTYRYTVSEIDM